MRETHTAQTSIFQSATDHEIAHELKRMSDWLDGHPELLDRVAEDLQSGTGMIGLGELPGGAFNSNAQGVSADGSVVVGNSFIVEATEAFRWTSGTGIVGLGDLPGGNFNSSGEAISGDGSVVVGWGSSASGQEAFVWTQGDGTQSLHDVLMINGATGFGGWQLQRANGISADGQWVVGHGIDDDYDPVSRNFRSQSLQLALLVDQNPALAMVCNMRHLSCLESLAYRDCDSSG